MTEPCTRYRARVSKGTRRGKRREPFIKKGGNTSRILVLFSKGGAFLVGNERGSNSEREGIVLAQDACLARIAIGRSP